MRQFLNAVALLVLVLFVGNEASAQIIPAYIPQNGLVGWWPFTTAATDESVGTNDGTVNGATLTTDRFGWVRSAYSFDGVNDNITFPNAINFGVNSFTISLYVYPKAWTSAQGDAYIYGTPFTAGTLDQGFRFGTTANRPGGGSGFLAAIGDAATNDYVAYSQQPVTLNTWYYLTMVFNRDASTFTLYVNGQVAEVIQVSANFANTDRGFNPTAGSFRLNDQLGNYFNGKIDDIAVWNRALTAQEVLDTYQACNFSILFQPVSATVSAGSNATLTLAASNPGSVTYQWQRKSGANYIDIIDPVGYSGMTSPSLTINSVDASDTGSYRCAMTMNGCDVKSDDAVVSLQAPTIPTYVPKSSLVGWWPFNGNANDESGNGLDGIVYGATLAADRSSTSNRSYSFDGVNDYINIGHRAVLDFATHSNMTFAFWVKADNMSNPGAVISKYQQGSSTNSSYLFMYGAQSIRVYGTGNPNKPLFTVNETTPESWTHIVAVLNHTSDSVTLYRDGVLLSKGAVDFNPNATTVAVMFGMADDGPAGSENSLHFKGAIDDVGIWTRALTATEISALYTSCDISITQQPSNANVAQGASQSITVSATSAKALTYQWQRDAGSGYSNVTNGGSYSGATTSTLTISAFSALTAGSFRCIVSNADCSVNSNAAVLSLSTSSCLDNPGAPNPWPNPTAANAGYIALGNLGQQAKFSVSMWVKPAAVQPATVTVLMDCSHGGSANWVIQTLNGGTTWIFLDNEFTLTPNTWQHVLCTYDNGASKVYINGTLVDQGTWVIGWSGTPNIYLGNWPEGGRRFKGQVDEVMITRNVLYTSAFTPKTTYISSDVPANSLGLWHFDEGSGTVTANDVGGATTAINNWTWATRNIIPCDITITGQPQGGGVNQNQSKTLTVTATASTQLTYQWQQDAGSGFVNVTNGGAYSGATTSSLTISPFTSSTAATYRCVLTTVNCTVNSSSAALTLTGVVNGWEKLLDSSQVLLNNIYFNPTAFDQVNNRIYGVNTSTNPMTVKVIDLNSLAVETIQVTRPIPRIDHYTFDPSSGRLIAVRAGRDNVYALNLSTKVWSQIGNGSQDDDSYGAVPYWNKSAGRPEFFSGYGYMTAKNWVYGNTGSGWTQIVANQNNCEPRKRTGTNPTLGHPDSNVVYFSSGQGNCTGNQYESSCSGGAAWASDVGKWCWLKDLYRYDITNAKFTALRSFSDPTYVGEGPVAFDYHQRRMYQIPLYVPQTTWPGSHTYFDTTRICANYIDSTQGYSRVQVTGQLPPAKSSGSIFYDGVNRRVVLVRSDGIWALQVGQTGCPVTITSQPTSKTAFGGHTTTLTVSASSSSALSYQWQRKVGADFVNVADGADYSGSGTDTLTIKSSRISIKGPYRCIVAASGGCSATSNEATLTVDCPCNAP